MGFAVERESRFRVRDGTDPQEELGEVFGAFGKGIMSTLRRKEY